MGEYQVVYQTRGLPSEGGGFRTRTFLKDAEALERWYTPEVAKDYLIVAAGIMNEATAIALCMQTSFESNLGMIVAEATNPTTGEVNKRDVVSSLKRLGLAKQFLEQNL
ncbi:hypothetical protein HYU17_05385 [Candidatus Woesearchaeota archaeon]|nr:hypothetical protein [Candidatus Woesearchaeota archaeon]